MSEQSERLVTKLIAMEDVGAWRDAYTLCKQMIGEDAVEILGANGMLVAEEKNLENVKKALEYGRQLRKNLARRLKAGDATGEQLYWNLLLMASPYDFDSYCRYIEKDREPSKRFYEPRRKQLFPLALDLQRLEDNELELLAVSMPPGTGKSTLEIFFLCWTSGLHPELQCLMSSHNVEFLKGVYEECLRIMDADGEYRWADVFPTVKIVGENAKNMRIDLGKRKRFQTIELTSLGAGNAGKVRATNFLICDDLCQGIEQAMSPDQMQKLWQKYSTDLRQRKQGNRVKELHIQTRWSVNDVVGHLQDIYEGSDRVKFVNVPALNEDGQSNFDYPFGLGYTTDMIHDLEASMDDARRCTWANR